MNNNKHTGVNTGTIIRTRGNFKTNPHDMEQYRFCNTCIYYNFGKCDGGDIKGVEIADTMYATKCRKYKSLKPKYIPQKKKKTKKRKDKKKHV